MTSVTDGFPEAAQEILPPGPVDFFGSTIRAALAAGVITSDVLSEHVTAELLAQCLPRPVWARVLTAMLGSARATMEVAVEAIGAGALLAHLPPELVWGALAEAGRRALAAPLAAEEAPAEPVAEAAPEEPLPLTFENYVLPLREEAVNHALRLCHGNEQLAEDIVQDAFVRAFRAWSSSFQVPDGVTPDSAVRGWLFTIVKRTFITDFASRRDRRELVSAHVEEIVENTCATGEIQPRQCADGVNGGLLQFSCFALPEPPPGADAPSTEVVQAIARLSPKRRAVVERFYFRGMSCDEIAADLNIPEPTVRTTLVRARTKLKALLATFAKREYGLGSGLVVDAGVEATAEAPEAEEAQTYGVERIVR